MTRSRYAVLVLVAFAAGCSQAPASPSDLSVAGSPTAAKPGGGGTSTERAVTYAESKFGDPGHDGYPSPGHIDAAGTLTGTMSGTVGGGNLVVSASGTYTFRMTDVGPLPEGTSTGESSCTDAAKDLLRSSDLIADLDGTPNDVTGSLTITVDQDGAKGFKKPISDFEMRDIVRPDGTWKINGWTTENYVPVIEDGDGVVIVTLENGKANFARYPAGSRRADVAIGCRVDYTMTIAK
jgi:hypothetical protein